MENTPPTPQKKGLGPLAWLGLGCGGLVVLAIIGFVVVTMFFGDKIKHYAGEAQKFAEEAQKNPARATAMLMVKAGAGQFELVAEDDALKRYTVREKANGKLTTIYWDEKKQAPEVIPGDFSAIPAGPGAETAPTPVPQ